MVMGLTMARMFLWTGASMEPGRPNLRWQASMADLIRQPRPNPERVVVPYPNEIP